MKDVKEHAKNIREIAISYSEEESESLCDYIKALRREAWIEAREKTLRAFIATDALIAITRGRMEVDELGESARYDYQIIRNAFYKLLTKSDE